MFNLFVDESGKHNLKNVDVSAPHFLLSGIIVDDKSKENLKVKADRIKFKYWGRTDIVFHANDIRQQKNDFEIFRLQGAKFTLDDFYRDFKNFLNSVSKICLVSINKGVYLVNNAPIAHAISQLPSAKSGSGWDKQVKGASNSLLKEATTELLTMYLDYLNHKRSHGQVIVESSSESQDMNIYSAYNKLLTGGFPPFNMDTASVRKRLTGISFVTKHNHDIESQLADIAAHYLSVDAKITEGILSSYPKPNDKEIIDLLKSKTFSYKQTTNGASKNSYYKIC